MVIQTTKKNTYILGINLSHDGSACLLKNGQIAVAIEKERLTRIKHDGGNDKLAVEYCLQSEGITLNDVDLVVQNANFEKETIAIDSYMGKRAFAANNTIPVVTISHHLAHAYSAIGTSTLAKHTGKSSTTYQSFLTASKKRCKAKMSFKKP